MGGKIHTHRILSKVVYSRSSVFFDPPGGYSPDSFEESCHYFTIFKALHYFTMAKLHEKFESPKSIKILKTGFTYQEKVQFLFCFNRRLKKSYLWTRDNCCYYGLVRWEGRGRVILGRLGRPCWLVPTILAREMCLLKPSSKTKYHRYAVQVSIGIRTQTA